jgi:hypothetical protein
MNWLLTIYIFILFFILTPGILVRIPTNGGKVPIALTHALLFALIWHFTHKIIWNFSMRPLLM